MKPQAAIEKFDDLITELESELSCHSILRHPFLLGLERGTFSREGIRAWVCQQYFFSRQFSRCLAALYARIEDDRVARPLQGFMAIEHWGSVNSSAHWRQFTVVLQAFAIDVEELRRLGPDEHTRRYLDYRLNMCLTGTPSEALGVVAYAHEFVNQRIFASYLSGMEHLRLDANALEYFRSHVDDEPEDYRILRAMIGYLVSSRNGEPRRPFSATTLRPLWNDS